MATHTGTHLDAPCHFARGQWSVVDIPIHHLIDRPIAVIDVVQQSVTSRDYEASVEDFKQWEETNGKIPDKAVVLVKTGWARFWPKKLEYFGTESSDLALVHFPGVHPDAALWLTENRDIVGIGIDGPSIDHGQSKQYKSHQIFANKNIYIFENIAKSVHQLPPIGAKLHTLPLKIEGASGTPVTIIATIDSLASISAKCQYSVSILLLAFLIFRYISC
jgi:kynurenine formamidase